MAFFVLDENNNRIEALDKEGVFAALEKAIADGSLADLVADSAFVSKLKCCVSGVTNKVGFITEAKLNELIAAGTVEQNTIYFITDDASLETINKALKETKETLQSLEKWTHTRVRHIVYDADKVPTGENQITTNILDILKADGKTVSDVIGIGVYMSFDDYNIYTTSGVFGLSNNDGEYKRVQTCTAESAKVIKNIFDLYNGGDLRIYTEYYKLDEATGVSHSPTNNVKLWGLYIYY